MSKNRKNFHYHYAEQYETREERRARIRRERSFCAPPTAVIMVCVMLILFSFVSVTFSAFVSPADSVSASKGGVASDVMSKYARLDKEYAVAAAGAKQDLAAVGAQNADIAEVGANADVAEAGAKVDLAQTGSITSSDASPYYIFYDVTTVSWWNDGNAQHWGNFRTTTNGTVTSSPALQVDGNIYGMRVPNGTYSYVLLCRGASYSAGTWGWNNTGEIPLQSDKNKITTYAKDTGGSASDWGTYIPTSTGALHVGTSSSTTATTTAGTSVTLYPSLASNTTYNDYYAANNEFTVKLNGSAAANTDYTLSGTTFTPLQAGVFTITAKVGYNAKGYTGINAKTAVTSAVTVVSNTKFVALHNYKIVSNVGGAWENNISQAQVMTKNSSDQFYYDFYLKKNEVTSSDYLLYRLYDTTATKYVAPDWESDHRHDLTSAGAANGDTAIRDITSYEDKDTCWKAFTNFTNTTDLFRVRVYYDPAATATYSATTYTSGKTWYEVSALTAMDPVVSLSPAYQHDTYDLTSHVSVTADSNIGDVSYSSWEYSYDGGAYSPIASPTQWSPENTGTYTIRVTATDGGVKTTNTSDNNYTKNAITARTQTTSTSTIIVTIPPYCSPVIAVTDFQSEDHTGETPVYTIYEDQEATIALTHGLEEAHDGSMTLAVTDEHNDDVASTHVTSTETADTYKFWGHTEGTYTVTASCSVSPARSSTVTIVVQERELYLCGFVNDAWPGYSNWASDYKDDRKMFYDPDDKLYHVSISLNENTGYNVTNLWDTNSIDPGNNDGFKFYDGDLNSGTYYGNTGAINPNTYAVMGTNWGISSSDRNCGLTTGAAGDYEFTLKYSGSATGAYFNVNYPADHYYLAGDFNPSGPENASSSYQLTTANNGATYTLTLNCADSGATFTKSTDYTLKICTNSNFQHNMYGKNGSDISDTATVNLTKADSVTAIEFKTGGNGSYTFTFTPGATPTLRVTYPPDSYYLNIGGTLYLMTEDNGTFTKSLVCADSGGELDKSTQYSYCISKNGSTASTHRYYYSTDITAAVNNVTLTSGSATKNITTGANGTYTFTFTPGATKYLTVTYPADQYYLVGTFYNNNTADDNVIFTDDDSDGVYELTILCTPTATTSDEKFHTATNYNIRISKNGSTANANLYQFAANITESSGLTGTTVNNSGGTVRTITTAAKGRYKFKFTPATGAYEIEFPGKTYHLLGFNSADEYWTDNDGNEMVETEKAGVFEKTKFFTAADLSYTAETKSGFKIYCNDNTYYGASTTVTYSANSNISLSASGAYMGFNSWYSGTYTFTLDTRGGTKTLTVTPPTRSVTASAHRYVGDVYTEGLSSSLLSVTNNYNDTWSVTATANNDEVTFVDWIVTGADSYTVSNDTTVNVTVTSTSAVTIVAKYRYRGYTITLDAQGGTISDASWTQVGATSSYQHSYEYGTGYGSNDGEDHFPEPTRDGYIFDGWYDSSTETPYSTRIKYIANNATGNRSLVAKWDVVVTFYDDVTGEFIEAQRVVSGGSATPPDPVSYIGFESTPQYDGTYENVTSNQTVYVWYYPVASVSFKITPLDHVEYNNSDTMGSNTDPYRVSFGAVIQAEAEGNDYDDSGIYYVWSTDGSNYAKGTVHDDVSDEDVESDTHYFSPNIATLMTVTVTNNTPITIRGKACYVGRSSGSTRESSDASYTIYYQIDTPLTGVSFNPHQKIYNSGANVSISATMTSYSSITDDFRTRLYYYSRSSSAYTPATFTVNNALTDLNSITSVSGDDYSSVFSSDLVSRINSPGVNYYYVSLLRTVTTAFDTDDSSTGRIHTTVGTSSVSSNRPLYFVNKSSIDFEDLNYRVMIFYTDSSGNLHYQTGSHTTRTGADDAEVYRFDIPASVSSVQFGVFSNASEYALPVYSAGALTFTNYVYHSSEWTTVTDVQAVKITISESVMSVTTGMLDINTQE